MEFSEVAIQKLLQLFPELSALIVSFKDISDELVDSGGSNAKVGVFIIKGGEKFYYLPIISKSDAIQPIDSLFDVEEQAFIPLTKSFVTRLTSSPVGIGGRKAKVPGSVVQNPSLYNLVVPPRTGKYAYASSSKLEGFFTLLPNMVKKSVVTSISSNKDVYSALHKLFGLENLFAALKPTLSVAPAIEAKPLEVITSGVGLSHDAIQDILSKGYHVQGTPRITRVAIPANNYEDMGKLRMLGSIDSGQDFDICMRDGTHPSARILKTSKFVPRRPAMLRDRAEELVAIYEDGRFSITHSLVASGEGRSENLALSRYLENTPLITPSKISMQVGTFAILSPELELVDLCEGPRVNVSQLGATIRAYSLLTKAHVVINAYHNATVINCQDRANIFIPFNTPILELVSQVPHSNIEVNINAAADRLDMQTLTSLGGSLSIGYDGIDFSVDRKPVGNEAGLMKVLTIREGIDPLKAESFIKQAKEKSFLKVYLSKQADEQGQIPSYGEAPPPQESVFPSTLGMNTNLSTALTTNDPEVIEATIISELLQVEDMNTYIGEYLPDIKNSIDKLGRALFLCRMKSDKLAENHTAAEVSTFVANLRNTYRMLGDTYVKLESMIATG